MENAPIFFGRKTPNQQQKTLYPAQTCARQFWRCSIRCKIRCLRPFKSPKVLNGATARQAQSCGVFMYQVGSSAPGHPPTGASPGLSDGFGPALRASAAFGLDHPLHLEVLFQSPDALAQVHLPKGRSRMWHEIIRVLARAMGLRSRG